LPSNLLMLASKLPLIPAILETHYCLVTLDSRWHDVHIIVLMHYKNCMANK